MPADLKMTTMNPATYDLFSRGDTAGIFQFEGAGIRRRLRQLKPSCFADLLALLALYRPGPLRMGMVDDFIKSKRGARLVNCPLPQLEDVLRETYGVLAFQEQMMEIAQVVASYTLGGADLMRRALGKKNPASIAAERIRFVEGASQNDISSTKAKEVFDLLAKFTPYAGVKAHCASYALIAFQSAYIKAHYMS